MQSQWTEISYFASFYPFSSSLYQLRITIALGNRDTLYFAVENTLLVLNQVFSSKAKLRLQGSSSVETTAEGSMHHV